MPNFIIQQLDQLPGVPCPCGTARRAFAEPGKNVASVHLVQIEATARAHYHQRMTEIYVILEGEGHLELDGVPHPVRPMTAVYIQPGCRHRAIGSIRILNIPIPAFDETDEWFD